MGLTLLQEDLAQSIREQTTRSGQSIENGIVKNLEEWSSLANDVHESARSSVSILDDLLVRDENSLVTDVIWLLTSPAANQNFDKVESGTLSLELTIFPLLGLVRDTYKEFRLSAQNKRIDFKLKFRPSSQNPHELPNWDQRNFVGDSIRITQVLRNLISNAIKFTPEGGSYPHLLE